MGHGEQDDRRRKEERLRSRQTGGQEPGEEGRETGRRREESVGQIEGEDHAQPLIEQEDCNEAESAGKTQGDLPHDGRSAETRFTEEIPRLRLP